MMKLFNFILGLFAIMGSVYSIFYPGMSFLSAGWMIAVLLGVWGIAAIMNYFSRPKEQKPSGTQAVFGVIGLIAGIVAAILSITALFSTRVSLILDVTVIGMFCGWMILNGISSILTALTIGKKIGSKTWGLTLVLGIIMLIGGIYGCGHLFFMARTMGLIFGWLLLAYGIRLIASLLEKN